MMSFASPVTLISSIRKEHHMPMSADFNPTDTVYGILPCVTSLKRYWFYYLHNVPLIFPYLSLLSIYCVLVIANKKSARINLL